MPNFFWQMRVYQDLIGLARASSWPASQHFATIALSYHVSFDHVKMMMLKHRVLALLIAELLCGAALQIIYLTINDH